MSFSPRLKFYITLVGSAAVVAAVGFFGVNLSIKEIKDTNAKIFEERKKLSSLTNQESYRRELKNEAEQVDFYEDATRDWLVSRDRLLDFIMDLEQIAENTNNTHEISLQNDKSKEGDSFFFQVQTTASLSDLMRFLTSIESLSYQSDITSLNIQSKNPLTGANEYSASFILKVNVK